VRRVVLVSLGAAAPGEALLAGVEELSADGADVRLVSRTAPTPALAAALAGRTALGRPGRGQVAVGKLKVDPHRLPGALALVLSRRTRGLVRAADALVAVDAAALPAAWLAARVNRRAIAVNGLPAALTRLTRPAGAD
jgi:hypothetical protein